MTPRGLQDHADTSPETVAQLPQGSWGRAGVGASRGGSVQRVHARDPRHLRRCRGRLDAKRIVRWYRRLQRLRRGCAVTIADSSGTTLATTYVQGATATGTDTCRLSFTLPGMPTPRAYRISIGHRDGRPSVSYEPPLSLFSLPRPRPRSMDSDEGGRARRQAGPCHDIRARLGL